MLNYEEKRKTDAAITKAFLNDTANREIISRIIAAFGKVMRERLDAVIPGCHFYLKGGNAFSMLKGEVPTGDYDFQLVLPRADYEDWYKAFLRFDPLILEALKASLAEVEGRFTDTVFETVELAAMVPDVDFTGITKGERQRGISLLGSSYGYTDYAGIVQDRNYTGKYMRNARLDVDRTGWTSALGPVIYVNYVIPEFLLYRLIYSYKYIDAGGAEFELKSEIIDVTVPRKGSAEVFLAQEGAVTWFRRTEQGFDLPGWGYHFYENINLLQEIELGISSSADKKEKRMERGRYAMDRLKDANTGGLFQQSIVEADGKRIQGYLGALIYPVSDYSELTGGAAGLPAVLVDEIKGKLSDNYRFCIDSAGNGADELEGYVKFWFDKGFHRTEVTEQQDIVQTIANLGNFYNMCQPCREAQINGRSFRYLTPSLRPEGVWLLPLDFASAAETDTLYMSFLPYMKAQCQFCQVEERDSAFYAVFRRKRYEFYLVIQKCGKSLPAQVKYPELFLQKSLLTVQRVPIARALYPVGNYAVQEGAGVKETGWESADAAAQDIGRELEGVVERGYRPQSEDGFACDIIHKSEYGAAQDIVSGREGEAAQDNGYWLENHRQVAGIHADAPAVAEIFIVLQEKREKWTLSENFGNLPGYMDEQGNEHPFLACLTLRNLVLPGEPETDRISFRAVMEKEEVPFLKEVPCCESLEQELPVDCSLTWIEGGGILFQADCAPECASIWISGLEYCVERLSFSSGMETDTFVLPGFSLVCRLGTGESGLRMELRAAPGERFVTADGSRAGTESLSMDQLLSLFQINAEEFRFCEALPEGMGAKLFDRLKLQSVSMNILRETEQTAQGQKGQPGTDTLTVHTMNLEVSAEAAWNIFGSVSIMPRYSIHLYSPYDPAARCISFSAAGDWTLGKTVYEISVDPFMGDVRIWMKDGQTVDFEPFGSLFFQAPLPEVKIGTLSASVNYRRGSSEFLLKASDVWRFSLTGRELAVESVELKVWNQNQTCDIVINGELNFLGVLFELTCRYRGKDSYFLSAGTAADIRVKLTDYLQEFFDAAEIATHIPEEFLNIDIHELYLSYEKSGADSIVGFRAEIEHLFSVTDRFAIDDFYIETKITNGRTEQICLGAEFEIAGSRLYLTLEKAEAGLCLSGGTWQGQEIPVGQLLEGFLDAVLGYQVKLPGCLSTFMIHYVGFTYKNKGGETDFRIDAEAGFGKNGGVLDHLFVGETHITVDAANSGKGWAYAFQISCEIVLEDKQVLLCSWQYDESGKTDQNVIALNYHAKKEGDEVPFGTILRKLGAREIDSSWGFLTGIGITRAELAYDFVKKELAASMEVTGGDSLDVKLAFGETMDFQVVMASRAEISLVQLPVVGGLAARFNPSPETCSVSDITLYVCSPLYASETRQAGVGLSLRACGKDEYCQLCEIKRENRNLLAEGSGSPKTVWIRIEKTIAIFSLHRLGISLAGSRLGLLVDAGLHAAPLAFELLGAGIYADMGNWKDISFSLSGLGIALETEQLALTGSFMRTSGEAGTADVYSGCLALTAGNISAFAVGQYSEGSLMAYACVSVPLGGPPAFFIKGFAAGFGYNESLALPEIGEVADYPLIAGAMGKVGQKELPEQLSGYLTPSQGQFFLVAGVRFTSFEIADSFALLTVSFGKKTQVGLLGLSNLDMPPNCGDNPIAHAQLALRAAFLPDDGIVSVEALLTSESYLFSPDCRLTGGFAFYLWYGGAHAGDFVITLGGYHPAYTKPEHYPSVPRLGFCWDVIPQHPNRLVISGELYFAVTPSVLMAGGRLSAVYADGNLRAWFEVRADFLIGWKPFHYDISAEISLGASYRVDCLFVHHTFKIELGCGLHLWGPDFSGTAHISWFIISFTIRFGAGADQEPEKISWEEFAESFLPKAHKSEKSLRDGENRAVEVNPLGVSVSEGVIGQAGKGDETPVVIPEELELSFTTAFPCLDAEAEGTQKEKSQADGDAGLYVRPMGAAVRKSKLTAGLIFCGPNGEKRVPMTAEPVKRALPGALWASEEYQGELTPEVICGLACRTEPNHSGMFPEKSWISEEMLSEVNTIRKERAFDFSKTWNLPEYRTDKTIQDITDTAGRLKTEGKKFLASMGCCGECDISDFARYADSLLDEDVFEGRIV